VFGIRALNSRITVFLPPPEGEEMTKSVPDIQTTDMY